MAKTTIDIDESLLAHAAELLGTSTKRATVEAALRAVTVTAERARARELDAIASRDFDLTDTRDDGWR